MPYCCLLCVLTSTVNIPHIIYPHPLPRNKGCSVTVENLMWCATGLSEKAGRNLCLPTPCARNNLVHNSALPNF